MSRHHRDLGGKRVRLEGALTTGGIAVWNLARECWELATTLAGLTLTSPTIADFTNANHSHANAAGGGQLTVAALSDVAQAVQNFTVGTFTNLDACSVTNGEYSRVGSMVTCSGLLSVDPTAAGLVQFVMDLPVSASWAGTAKLHGTCVGNMESASGDVLRVYGGTAGAGNNKAIFRGYANHADAQNYTFIFQYLT